MTDLAPLFTAARLRPEFANHDDSLLDLSDDELRLILADLFHRTALLASNQYERFSDSYIDDCNITVSMMTTLHEMVYQADHSEESTYHSFFARLDDFIQDLTYLAYLYNGANGDMATIENFNKATVFQHITLDKPYA